MGSVALVGADLRVHHALADLGTWRPAPQHRQDLLGGVPQLLFDLAPLEPPSSDGPVLLRAPGAVAVDVAEAPGSVAMPTGAATIELGSRSRRAWRSATRSPSGPVRRVFRKVCGDPRHRRLARSKATSNVVALAPEIVVILS